MGLQQNILENLDMDLFQSIQERCSKAMGIASVTVDFRGRPITKYSEFTSHCKIGRQSKDFKHLCEQCDAHGGLHAAIAGEPYIYKCHAGLIDFAVPLILNGSYIGAVLGGQMRVSEEDEKGIESILPQQSNLTKSPELEKAFQEIEVVSYEKVCNAVLVLRDMITYIMEDDMRKKFQDSLDNKDKELAAEKVISTNLEAEIQKFENNSIRVQERFNSFFFIMNIITQLAYDEKAMKTQEVCYDFVDMMRYSLDSDRKISTLGEELSNTVCLLRIQNAWLTEGLTYNFVLEDKFKDILCPYMLFQTIFSHILEILNRYQNEEQHLDMEFSEDRDDLLIQIFTSKNCSQERETGEESSDEYSERKNGLKEADKILRRIFGKKYEITSGIREEKSDQYFIKFKLPMKKDYI